MAMDYPCLHTVPKIISFEAARGARPAQRFLAPRAAFVPPPGRRLLVADFKQFELRMMLHFAGDAALTASLIGGAASGDPFTLLAARWCNKAHAADVSEAERTWAKSIAYGLLYGKGTHSLAVDLGVPVAEAAVLVDNFRTSLPGISTWLERVLVDARARAPEPYVLTLAGRRRALPALQAEVRCAAPCCARLRSC
jgi:DNA polymerase theta